MIKEATLTIQGMHCNNCAKTLTNGFLGQKGVMNARVDFPSKKAHVKFDDSKSTINELIAYAKSEGFSANISADQNESKKPMQKGFLSRLLSK